MWQSQRVSRENYLANHMPRICGKHKDLDGENDLADHQPHAQDMWRSQEANGENYLANHMPRICGSHKKLNCTTML